MQKRVNNEIYNTIPKKLAELNLDEYFYFVEYDFHFANYDNNNGKSVFVINKKSKHFEMQIDLPENYPFRPPKVLINTQNSGFYGSGDDTNWVDYNRWSFSLLKKTNNSENCKNYNNAILFSKIKRPLLKKYWSFTPIITSSTCLCCNNYLCNNNWKPSNTLVDILCEYIVRKDFEIYTKKKHLKLISGIFTNLPDDVIYHIVELL